MDNHIRWDASVMVHLDSFRNIDLLEQGWYTVRIRMHTLSGINSIPDGFSSVGGERRSDCNVMILH